MSAPGSPLGEAAESSRVVVIGTGPAGLECARIACERGHEVRVFEADRIVGGQLALWAAAPSMGELGNIIRWRISELDRLGVRVHTNHLMSRDEVDRLDADVVIIATGSDDYCRTVAGDHRIEIVSPHTLLRGSTAQAGKALVCNEGRGQAGLAAAELLLNNYVEVEIVTSDIAVAADLDPTNRNAWYERLGRKNCFFTAGHVVDRASCNTVTLRNVRQNPQCLQIAASHRTQQDIA